MHGASGIVRLPFGIHGESRIAREPPRESVEGFGSLEADQNTAESGHAARRHQCRRVSNELTLEDTAVIREGADDRPRPAWQSDAVAHVQVIHLRSADSDDQFLMS